MTNDFSPHSPIDLPKCIALSVAYGQCCTIKDCIETTNAEGICEDIYNAANATTIENSIRELVNIAMENGK